MSSSSQIERSSSQTRILPTRSSRRQGRAKGFRRAGDFRQGALVLLHPSKAHHETGSFTERRTRPNFALVCLNDLVNNRESESRPAFEVRLKRPQLFFDLLRSKAPTGVGDKH